MSSEEVQQELVEQIPEATEQQTSITDVPTHTPADIAAAFFDKNKRLLKTKLSTLSQRQLKRVLFNAAAYPFTDAEYKPRTEEEKSVIYLLSEMMLNKAIMQLQFEMERAEKASNKEQEEKSKEARELLTTQAQELKLYETDLVVQNQNEVEKLNGI